MEIIQSIIFFIVAIGILVTVHEFGHFWVARRLGVKVLRFSVGFGKPLLMRKAGDGTEYTLAAIPLGGYVRMLGEQDDEINETNRHQAFNHKPLIVRTAIVSAGPLLNFIFAIMAYWLIYTVGLPGQIAMIGEITGDSIAAQAGMKADEQIIRVNDTQTPDWTTANDALLKAVIADTGLDIHTRTDSGGLRRYRLSLTDRAELINDNGLVSNLGLKPWRPPVWIGEVTAGGPAHKAGLQQGDLIISADGQEIHNWTQWVRYISERPGRAIHIIAERHTGQKELTVIPERVHTDGRDTGRIGVHGHIPEEIRRRHYVEVSYNPLVAVAEAVEQTWDLSILMVRMLGRMIVGEASYKNISGPITIAHYAGLTAELGWLEYVRFLALISISLGVLNLLPIPMLDGGHLLYYAIESVRGRPLSDEAMATGQQIGLIFLIMIMGLAFYNDFGRLLG